VPSLINLFRGNGETKTVTQAGEVTINLNFTLTLRMEQDGTVQLTGAQAVARPVVPAPMSPDRPGYISPFDDDEKTDIIDFGKQV
jgi:hypothetical protein